MLSFAIEVSLRVSFPVKLPLLAGRRCASAETNWRLIFPKLKVYPAGRGLPMGVGRVSGPPRIHDQAAARGGPRNPPAVATAGEVADYGAPRSGERARRESIGAP